MLFFNIITIMALIATGVKAQTYALNFTYDHTNWYNEWIFEDLPDPTHGVVEYQNLANAQALGLTKIINNQVYLGVDNNTVLLNGSSQGRKSIWIQSKATYNHYLMIADFEHMPGSVCGTWPGFWSIDNAHDVGEMDIIEGANTNTNNSMTLHTNGDCSFPARNQTGITNGAQCNQKENGAGCDTQGGQYGTAFNEVNGGVYATLWNSEVIEIYFWERKDIPQDVASGKPNPDTWGMPLAQFAGAGGGCDIDASFQNQNIAFDTTFCGANAGNEAWTNGSTCSKTTGYATCEEYVQAHPEAFSDTYWLVNYVKVYTDTGAASPSSSVSVSPSTSSVAAPQPTSSISQTQSSVVASRTPSFTFVKATSTSHAESPLATMKVSSSGSCGTGVTCQGSTFGNCCSHWGYCGSSTAYCGDGCQSGFGSCGGGS